MLQITAEDLFFQFIIILIFMSALLPAAYFSLKSMTKRKSRSGKGSYQEYDSSIITRIIHDRSTGEEHLISGHHSDTFRDTCDKDWPFDAIGKDEPWIVTDDRGNDISDASLSSYDGMVRIALPLGYERADTKENDESDSAVTYYE
jgi:hypothetical protein